MIKPGVIIYGIKPEMVMCHTEINKVFIELGYDCIPTSVVGKKHKEYSLHPVGFAIDYKTKHILSQVRETKLAYLLDRLKTALPQCDFLLEHIGGAEEHIHAEFDPKDDSRFAAAKIAYRKTGVWSDVP